MALNKRTVSWPLDGGLDTKTAPLMVQPGSFLQVDNAIQERAGEWRRRNGFTQVAADTSTSYASAFHVGAIGDTGFAGHGQSGPGVYRSSLTSNKWTGLANSDYPSNITRFPVAEAKTTNVGFAMAGNVGLVSFTSSLSPAIHTFDVSSGAVTATSIGTSFTRTKCAATSTHVCAFLQNGGTISVYTLDVATGVLSGPATMKSGLNAAGLVFDAHWYGGSTITVVAVTAAFTLQFMEFNPSTGTLSTDVTIGTVTVSASNSLLPDPGASGIRFVAISNVVPDTRVIRVNSAGTVQTNDQVEAVTSTAITGVGSGSGANWTVVYKTSSALRTNHKTGGVVGTPSTARTTNTGDLSIDCMAWGDDSASFFQCILGLHSSSATDPQDTWVIATFPKGSGASSFTTHSVIVPGQGSEQFITQNLQAMRVSQGLFKFCLPVLFQYRNDAGTITRQYSMDVFTMKMLTNSDIAIENVGKPVKYKQTAFFPANGISMVDGGSLRSIGTAAPPREPTLSQAAGGSLTALGQYQYCFVVERKDVDGNIWRSPPSVPASITLTGGNQTVAVTGQMWYADEPGVIYTVGTFRTAANGSVFRRIRSDVIQFSSDVSFNDTSADADIVDGEILYTTGELPTSITPPASHLAIFNDRLWAANRDFRTELWPSKNLRPGRQPEFVAEGVLDIDDAYGDITGLANLDDKGVVFKRQSIYFVDGDGLTDAGSGETHRYVQVAQDIGAIPGSPICAAGGDIYFVSDRGIYSIARDGETRFVGAPVDQYLNQPLVQTQETIYDSAYHPSKNWVIFVTTNYILIHDRTFGYWSRWTGLSGMRRILIVNNQIVLFKSDGTVWREGGTSQTTDQGTSYTAVIRSPWIRPANFDGQIRLYRGMCTATRTSGGATITPTLTVYLDNSETPVQSFTPASGIAGATALIQMEARPQRQNCSAFSLALTLPNDDVTLRVDKMGAEIGIRGTKGQKRTDADRWT